MEIKNEYKILELEGNIVLKQESWKTMDLKEAHKELLGLRNHIIQLEGKRKQIEKQIEEKFLDKQIEEITENETKTKDLEEKWSELITPVLEFQLKLLVLTNLTYTTPKQMSINSFTYLTYYLQNFLSRL